MDWSSFIIGVIVGVGAMALAFTAWAFVIVGKRARLRGFAPPKREGNGHDQYRGSSEHDTRQ